jgi:hypothetical protein
MTKNIVSGIPFGSMYGTNIFTLYIYMYIYIFWHSLCSGPGPAHCIHRQGGGTRMEEEVETLHLCENLETWQMKKQ